MVWFLAMVMVVLSPDNGMKNGELNTPFDTRRPQSDDYWLIPGNSSQAAASRFPLKGIFNSAQRFSPSLSMMFLSQPDENPV
jgi:hypothetical protein